MVSLKKINLLKGENKTMKIKQEHYNYLKDKIRETVEKNGIDRVKQYYKLCMNSREVKNPKIRVMFDLKALSIKNDYIIKNLYPYLNDTHITTALLKIGEELKIYENK